MGGYKLGSVQGKEKGKSWGNSTAPACGGEYSSSQRIGDISSIYEGQESSSIEDKQMYRTYRTTKDTIMGVEIENTDITLKLITDLDRKEYVMVKRQKEVTIYNLSLVGNVTEIVHDVSFKEYRDITYARLDKELLEQGIKPRRR